MISVLLSRLVLLVFGTLYPAYASYKTVKTKNVRDYVKWMMYWIVFALYTFIEIFTDIFLAFWFPFYYEFKILFVLWLICPATRGSTYIFRKVINPQLSKHEAMIDSYIASLWDHGYDILRKIGAQGFDYLIKFVLELLHKGQITAANFLPKLSEPPTQVDSVIKPDINDEQKLMDETALDDDDFDILMVENPELYNHAIAASSAPSHPEEETPTESDSNSEDSKSTRKRPLRVSARTKAKNTPTASGVKERRKRASSQNK